MTVVLYVRRRGLSWAPEKGERRGEEKARKKVPSRPASAAIRHSEFMGLEGSSLGLSKPH